MSVNASGREGSKRGSANSEPYFIMAALAKLPKRVKPRNSTSLCQPAGAEAFRLSGRVL
jgi:hypothetical protein